jgi:4-amino-4-deoxy-L-arabinose transferase-like glycosyltransferase
MDHEWREASDLRTSIFGIGVVVLSAAVLRAWNLWHAVVDPTEAETVSVVAQLIHTGTYHPSILTRPTLPVYVQGAVAVAQFLCGATLGWWSSVNAFGAEQIVLWGRAFSAVLGTAAVLLVHQVGLRWGARHALLAAGLMAVTPIHVAASREIGYGAPLTLFAVLALLTSLKAAEHVTTRAFVIAGAASGLAAASHYAGVLTIVMPLIAAWMTHSDDSSRLRRAGVALAAAIICFVAATPLAVRDLPAFLNGFAAAASPYHTEFSEVTNVDVLRALVAAIAWPGLLLAVGGLVLAAVRAFTGPGHIRWALLATFPFLYVILIASHGATSDVVLLPALPAVTLLAAIAVISGVSQLRRFDIPRPARTMLIAALTIAAVLPPAVFSLALIRQQGRETAATTPAIGLVTNTGR